MLIITNPKWIHESLNLLLKLHGAVLKLAGTDRIKYTHTRTHKPVYSTLPNGCPAVSNMEPKPEATASWTLSLNLWRNARIRSALLHPSALGPSRSHFFAKAVTSHSWRSRASGDKSPKSETIKEAKVGHWRRFFSLVCFWATVISLEYLSFFSASRFSRDGLGLALR